MADVALKKVEKEYPGGVQAVRDANLDIADGEFVVLLGPSGCGKSTMLRMIAGLEEVTTGTIAIGGQAVNDLPPKERDIAMVFQNYALYPHMTVADNLAFGLKMRKYPREEIRKRVADVAAILGITELLDRKPKTLSGGQRQRVAVGRALVRRPAVFLFDEPLSNLDAKLRVEMRVELNKLHQRLAATMIYVTHDQVEAMTLADRIVLMDRGSIQQVASPLVLYDEPFNQFVASFIGTPPMNFIDGKVENSAAELAFTDGRQIHLPLAKEVSGRLAAHVGRNLRLGIRPEHLHAKNAGASVQWGARVKARVEVVESLGHEKVVHFSDGAHRYISKVDAHLPIGLGEEVEVFFETHKAHVFDPVSGLNLTCRVSHYEPAADSRQKPPEVATGN
jgi:multiple sugar transport system ATP-binding protein